MPLFEIVLGGIQIKPAVKANDLFQRERFSNAK